MTSSLWRIVEDWRNGQPIPPTWAQVAKRLGVSQSTFDTWKAPAEMPQRRNLWVIHELTRVPFKSVVDAAIESVDLYSPERARDAARKYREGHKKAGEGDDRSAPSIGEGVDPLWVEYQETKKTSHAEGEQKE